MQCRKQLQEEAGRKNDTERLLSDHMAPQTPETARSPSSPAGPAGPAGPAPKEAGAEPLVEGFRIEAKRLKDAREIIDALSPLQFLEIVQTRDSIALVNIERRDIQKRPYLFSITYLNPDSIEVLYSYLPDVSPKKRRLDIARYLLNLATILESVYFINHAQLFQIIDGMLSRLVEYTISTYDELFSRYDALKEENDRTKKTSSEILAANEKLSKANREMKERETELLLRIKELETYPDDVLTAKIQSWLMEHNFEINITDFSRINKVSEARVEQMLNSMVRQGLLALRE